MMFSINDVFVRNGFDQFEASGRNVTSFVSRLGCVRAMLDRYVDIGCDSLVACEGGFNELSQ